MVFPLQFEHLVHVDDGEGVDDDEGKVTRKEKSREMLKCTKFRYYPSINLYYIEDNN